MIGIEAVRHDVLEGHIPSKPSPYARSYVVHIVQCMADGDRKELELMNGASTPFALAL